MGTDSRRSLRQRNPSFLLRLDSFGSDRSIAVGYVAVYGIAASLAVVLNGISWLRSRGKRRLSVLSTMTRAFLASALASLAILGLGLLIDGYLTEPARLVAILMVLTLPMTTAVGVLFLAIGPRRFPGGRCARCGYDLQERASERCPECGAAVDCCP